MRKIICIEEKVTIPDQWLLAGSVDWPDEGVPVGTSAWPISHAQVIGHATDFRREAGGEITAEVTLMKSYEGEADISYTFYANNVVWGSDPEYGRTVKSCMMRHIYIDFSVPWATHTGPGANPGAELEAKDLGDSNSR